MSEEREKLESVVLKQELLRRAIEVSSNALKNKEVLESENLHAVIASASKKLKQSIESMEL